MLSFSVLISHMCVMCAVSVRLGVSWGSRGCEGGGGGGNDGGGVSGD